jgi:hypothetical protein
MMRMFHAMETLINPTVALARWDARGRVRNRFDGFPRSSKAVETARFSARHPVHRAKATVLMRSDDSGVNIKCGRVRNRFNGFPRCGKAVETARFCTRRPVHRAKATVLMRRDDSGVNIKG